MAGLFSFLGTRMYSLILATVLAAAPWLELDTAGNEVAHSAEIAHRIGGDAEVRMPDGSRCDVLTDTQAIEVEWASKWQESCGQATLYAIWTNKQPCVYLLVKDWAADRVDVLRCRLVCERLKIPVVVVKVPEG